MNEVTHLVCIRFILNSYLLLFNKSARLSAFPRLPVVKKLLHY